MNRSADIIKSILYEHVQDFVKGIADGTPGKQDYVNAAKTLRLPYWDWASKEESGVFPLNAVSNTYDRSKVPKSSTSWFERSPKPKVYNPLFQYPFPEGTRQLVGAYVSLIFRVLYFVKHIFHDVQLTIFRTSLILLRGIPMDLSKIYKMQPSRSLVNSGNRPIIGGGSLM